MTDTHDTAAATETIEVVRSDENSRYEVRVGSALAGVAEFRERGERTVFTHTEVFEAFQGRGLASRLVTDAIADAVARDRLIVPVCPYVSSWLSEHDVPDARIEMPEAS